MSSPPKAAEFLLKLSVSEQDRDAIIGDLNEAYAEKSEASESGARSWYWKQAVTSLPFLLWRRASGSSLFPIAAILFVTAFAFAFVAIWDVHAARRLARFVNIRAADVPLEHIRLIYFGAYMLGAAIAGGIIASTIFTRRRTFIVNTALFLGPIMAVIFTDSLIRFWFSDSPSAASYFWQRVGMAFPALICGAFIGMRFTRASDR